MSNKRVETYKELALEFKRTKSDIVFTKIYKRMYKGIKSYITNFVKDDDIADDIINNTMVKIYNRIDEYDENYQITTWAYKIARNEALATLKESSKIQSIDELEENVGFDIMDDCGDCYEMKSEEDYMEEDKLLQMQTKCIYDEIQKLPEIYKNYLNLRLYKNVSYNDILEQMKELEPNINLGTVKNRIHLGKQMVRKRLESNPLFTNIKSV